MKHVIIGAGAAGISAAKTLRGLNADDEITVISSDDKVYSRCMLHYYISRKRTVESLNFAPEDFFTSNNITWKNGCTVKSIDSNAKQVITNTESIPYDKLLIATGSSSFIPPVGNLREASNVYSLRHLTDALAIESKADKCSNVVVVGAGLVGMDAAFALLELKKNVTVVEMADQILPLNLDSEAALAYQQLFEQNGCSFSLSSAVKDTTVNKKGDITSVVLANGTEIPCDMVVVAVGVRPEISFLDNTNITTGKGIIVDDHLQTSVPDVYAAGDVTAVGEIWPIATAQGKTAALNMHGIPTSFTDNFSAKNTINFFGLTTLSIGDSTGKNGGETILRQDKNKYHKFVVNNGRVTGLLMQGNVDNSGFWQYLIKNKLDIMEIDKPIWKLSFADFYGIDQSGQYKWSVVS